MQLQQAREELDRLEVQTLVVTFEGREAAREYLDETGLIWPLLVDTERRLYLAYDMHAARLRHLWGFATMRAYGYEESPYGIEWMRLDSDCPQPDLIKTIPHVAFEVDDLLKEIKGKNVIVKPTSPSAGVLVAFIEDNGAPIELIQIER